MEDFCIRHETRDFLVLSWRPSEHEHALRYRIEGLSDLFVYETIDLVNETGYVVDKNRYHFNGYRIVSCVMCDDVLVPVGYTETIMCPGSYDTILVRVMDAPCGCISVSFVSDAHYDLYRIVDRSGRVYYETEDCIVIVRDVLPESHFHAEGYVCDNGAYRLAAVSQDVIPEMRTARMMDCCDDTEHPLLSVVIPVYNSGMFLIRTVQSILSSCYACLEIILADDGSDSYTAEVCDWYADRYSYVHTYHLVNKGVCAARNFGMSVAKGEWLAFADNDDIVHPYMYQRLMSCAMDTGYDIVIGQCICHGDDGISKRIIASSPDKHVREMHSFSDVLASRGRHDNIYFCAVWNKVVRADVARKVRFDDEMPYYEDAAYTMSLYSYIKDFAFVSDAYYIWDRRRKLTEGTASTTHYKLPAVDLWRYWIMSCASCLFAGNPDYDTACVYKYDILEKLLSKYRNRNVGSTGGLVKDVYCSIMKHLVACHGLPVEVLKEHDTDLYRVWEEIDSVDVSAWDGRGSNPFV